jgi:hypothetical protein
MRFGKRLEIWYNFLSGGVKMSKSLLIILITAGIGLGLVFTAGCESDAQTGGVVGALAGAGIGQLAGGDTESTLVGAAVGGGVGYAVGNEQDKKKMRAEMYGTGQTATNTVTVNVVNSNGSITPVVLRIQGNVYVGPKGEQYMSLPTPEQLKPVYGF